VYDSKTNVKTKAKGKPFLVVKKEVKIGIDASGELVSRWCFAEDT
jgi:hypothetical protein